MPLCLLRPDSALVSRSVAQRVPRPARRRTGCLDQAFLTCAGRNYTNSLVFYVVPCLLGRVEHDTQVFQSIYSQQRRVFGRRGGGGVRSTMIMRVSSLTCAEKTPILQMLSWLSANRPGSHVCTRACRNPWPPQAASRGDRWPSCYFPSVKVGLPLETLYNDVYTRQMSV